MSDDADTPAPLRKRSLRFSLLNLLLMFVVVGQGLVILQLAPLREEVRQLRIDAGVLSIDDPDKIEAMELQGYYDSVWRYRVYLPPGRSFAIAVKWNDLPAEGTPNFKLLPTPNITISLGGNSVAYGLTSGEMIVELTRFVMPDGDHKYSLGVRDNNGWHKTSHGVIHSQEDQWPRDTEGQLMYRDSFFTGAPDQRRPAEKVILLDERFVRPIVNQDGSKTYEMGGAPPDEGVMLWIESR